MKNVSCNWREKHLRGNTLCRNWEEISQSVQGPELHLSYLRPLQEEGRRHGQRIGENHVLLTKGDLLVREGSSGKLDGISWGKKMFTSGKHWLKLSPSSILSQVGLVLLLVQLQSPEAQKYQGLPWVLNFPGERRFILGGLWGPGSPCRFN